MMIGASNIPRRTLDTDSYIRSHRHAITVRDDFATSFYREQLKIAEKEKRFEEEFANFKQKNQLNQQNQSQKHKEKLKNLDNAIQSEQQNYLQKQIEEQARDEMQNGIEQLLNNLDDLSILSSERQKSALEMLQKFKQQYPHYLHPSTLTRIQNTIERIVENLKSKETKPVTTTSVTSEVPSSSPIRSSNDQQLTSTNNIKTIQTQDNHDNDSLIFPYIHEFYQTHQAVYHSIPYEENLQSFINNQNIIHDDDDGMIETENNHHSGNSSQRLTDESILQQLREFFTYTIKLPTKNNNNSNNNSNNNNASEKPLKAIPLQKILQLSIQTKNYLNLFYTTTTTTNNNNTTEIYSIAIKSLLQKILQLWRELLPSAPATTTTTTTTSTTTTYNEEKVHQLLVVYLFGLFQSLPTKQKKKTFARVFQATLYHDAFWCYPDLLSVNIHQQQLQQQQQSLSRVEYFQQQKRFLKVFLLLLSYQATAELVSNTTTINTTTTNNNVNNNTTSSNNISLLNLHHGWLWILRSVKQILYLSQYPNTSTSTATTNIYRLNLTESLQVLYTFLVNFDYAASKYYSSTYDQLLVELQLILQQPSYRLQQESTKEILQLIQERIFNNHNININKNNKNNNNNTIVKNSYNLFYNLQDGSIVLGLLDSIQASLLITEITTLESEKQSYLMSKIKEYQLDRLRVIFNRLSATEESQVIAIQALQEKLVLASNYTNNTNNSNNNINTTTNSNNTNNPLLKFTLYKIISNILKDAQEEFFNEMDVLQPLRLVKLLTRLSKLMPSIVSLVRQQFYHACPVLIPILFPEDIDPSEYQLLLRVQRVKVKTEQGIEEVFESLDKYYARIAKVIVVFALSCVQVEQTPFTCHHLWRWLTQTTNTLISGALPIPPQYLILAYEVILRATTNELIQTFGLQRVLKLYQSIEEYIVLKKEVEDHWPRKRSLQEFLRRFLSSQGRDIMSLFTNNK